MPVITIEDCLEAIPDRFRLTHIAAKRARQLARGAESHLPWGQHKSTVQALHEIAAGHVTAAVLDEKDLPFVSEREALLPLDPLLE